MPGPFALLASAIPAGLQLAETVVNKPKREDFKPNTAGMEKYRAYLRGKSSSNEVARAAMEPALKTIGAQNRATGRQVDYAVGRGDLSSSEEAQLRITQGQQATGALQDAGQQAFALQQAENRRIGEATARLTADITQAEEQAKIDYENATKQYNKDIKTGILKVGASVATAGLSDFLTKQATSQSAFDALKAQGIDGIGSAEELAKAATEAGFTDSTQYANLLANREKMVQNLGQYDQAEIDSILGEGYDVGSKFRSGELGVQDYNKLVGELGTRRGAMVQDAYKKIADNSITVEDISSMNLPENVKTGLVKDLINQQSTLASDMSQSISGAIVSGDIKQLETLVTNPPENVKQADLTRATNAYFKLKASQDKQVLAQQKAILEAAEIPAGIASKIENFAGERVGLYGGVGVLSSSLGKPATELLSEIKKYEGSFTMTDAQANALTDKVNDYIKSLDLKGKDGDKINASIRAFMSDQGVAMGPKASAEVGLAKWLLGKVENMRSYSVNLSAAQQKAYQAAGGQVGYGSLGLTPPG